MDRRKLLGVLLMRDAFSMRNLTSFGLVALFFGIYVISGGKVTWVPKVSVNSAVNVEDQQYNSQQTQTQQAQPPERLIGDVETSGSRAKLVDSTGAKPAANTERDLAVDAPKTAELPNSSAEAKEKGAPTGDNLKSIRERLQNLSRGKGAPTQ